MREGRIQCGTIAELQNAALSLDTATLKPVHIEHGPGDIQLDKKHQAVWNNDRKHASAIVSPAYIKVDHAEVIHGIADALTNLGLSAKATVTDGGDTMMCHLEFPESRIGVKVGEEFVLGFTAINSYNKQTGIVIVPRVVRLACMNGMTVQVGWIQSFNVAHTNKLAGEFAKAIPAMLTAMVNGNAKFKALVETTIADSLEWNAVVTLATAMFKVDKHRNEILKRLREIHSPDQDLSRWDFYNCITNYATHGEQVTPYLEKVMQKKAQQVLTHSYEQLQAMELPAIAADTGATQ